MKTKNKNLSKYDRARKKIEDIKGFYNHLMVYIVVNIMLLVFRKNISFFIVNPEVLEDTSVLNWIDWNVYGTPILWGIGLAIHGFCVFGNVPFLGKGWEERKIKEFMQDENNTKKWH